MQAVTSTDDCLKSAINSSTWLLCETRRKPTGFRNACGRCCTACSGGSDDRRLSLVPKLVDATVSGTHITLAELPEVLLGVNDDAHGTNDSACFAILPTACASRRLKALNYLLVVNLRSIEFRPGFTSTCKSEVSLVQ